MTRSKPMNRGGQWHQPTRQAPPPAGCARSSSHSADPCPSSWLQQQRRCNALLLLTEWHCSLRGQLACACGWWATGRGREAAVGCLVPAANGGMLRALAHRRRSIANPRNHGSPALQYWRTIWQSALVRARYGDDRCSRPPRATCFSTAASAAGSPGLVNPCSWLPAPPYFVHHELRQ